MGMSRPRFMCVRRHHRRRGSLVTDSRAGIAGAIVGETQTGRCSSTRPSAWRAKRPRRPVRGIGSVGHGQPPKPVRAVVDEGLLDLGVGVHDERAVLRDRFADRAALQHAGTSVSRRRRQP